MLKAVAAVAASISLLSFASANDQPARSLTGQITLGRSVQILSGSKTVATLTIPEGEFKLRAHRTRTHFSIGSAFGSGSQKEPQTHASIHASGNVVITVINNGREVLRLTAEEAIVEANVSEQPRQK